MLLTNLMRAIILVIRLADLAFEARPNLGSNAYTIANFDRRHLVANLDGFADDFVADAKWEIGRAPSTGNGVYIGSANTAGIL